MFDKFINMNDHVNSVYRATYYHLKNIRSLKPFISFITVVHTFVTYHIDYCNFGQNGAAHMVTTNGKYSHVKIILYKQLSLPLKQRIHLNI